MLHSACHVLQVKPMAGAAASGGRRQVAESGGNQELSLQAPQNNNASGFLAPVRSTQEFAHEHLVQLDPTARSPESFSFLQIHSLKAFHFIFDSMLWPCVAYQYSRTILLGQGMRHHRDLLGVRLSVNEPQTSSSPHHRVSPSAVHRMHYPPLCVQSISIRIRYPCSPPLFINLSLDAAVFDSEFPRLRVKITH